jgi:release factor glutamine methyltransferase
VSDTWTIERILNWTHHYFRDQQIDTARLDAEVLLAAALETDRVYLYTHYDKPLSLPERDRFREWVRRRAAREPVAQILGRKEFFSRELEVTGDVMAPRPETEHLVDAVLDWVRERELAEPRILDLGTGSGAIAVTLAAELAGTRVVATDLSAAALAVAARNVERYRLSGRVELAEGDLFAPVCQPFDVIVCNPPYIDPDTRAQLAPEVRDWEPALALFADEHGLAVIRRLCQEAPEWLARPGLLAFEIGFDQGMAVRELLETSPWTAVEVHRDLQGHDRIVCAQV